MRIRVTKLRQNEKHLRTEPGILASGLGSRSTTRRVVKSVRSQASMRSSRFGWGGDRVSRRIEDQV